MALQLRKAGQPLGGLEFELCEGSAAPAPAVGPNVARRRRQRGGAAAKPAPFASVSMQGASSGAAPAAKHVPAFMVASAAESAPRDLTGVPQWRITAGDLAAGATAGCAVEAGARACWLRCLHWLASCSLSCQRCAADAGVRWWRPRRALLALLVPPTCPPPHGCRGCAGQRFCALSHRRHAGLLCRHPILNLTPPHACSPLPRRRYCLCAHPRPCLQPAASTPAAPLAALYPIDTIKTRLQAMRSGGGIRALLQAGGGRSLYAGVWGNLAGVAPASAIFMAVYEPTKQVGGALP